MFTEANSRNTARKFSRRCAAVVSSGLRAVLPVCRWANGASSKRTCLRLWKQFTSGAARSWGLHLDNVHHRVCTTCPRHGQEGCPCPGEYLLTLVVQAVETVDEPFLRRAEAIA